MLPLQILNRVFSPSPHNLTSILFPTAAVQIGLVENLSVGQFRQRFVKRPTFIWFDRANEKSDVIRQSAFENGAELLQWLEDMYRFYVPIVVNKIRAFK